MKLWRVGSYFIVGIVIFIISFRFFPSAKLFCENISLYVASRSLICINFVISPINSIINNIKSNSILKNENQNLRRDLSSYQAIQEQNSLLNQENQNLKEELKYQKSQNKKFITAKVISTNNNTFNHYLIIDKGSKDGIKIDNIVFSRNYVIGKVKNTTSNYSLITLITDPKSQIAVTSVDSKEKALIANVNGQMQLKYLKKDHKLKLNEEITTSNFSKLYYTNLPIGFISKISNNLIIVNLYANFQKIDFVSIELINEDMFKQIMSLSK